VQLVKRCADDLALVAKERKTEIYVTTAQPVIMIKADIRRVERILRNLLANAIDHAEEFRRLMFASRRANMMLQLEFVITALV
jgi:signal transduction histidine kinase